MQNMEVVDDVCRSSLACDGVDLIMIALLTITVALALVVVATIGHVWEAETVLDEELQRLAAERDACTVFTKRVAAIETPESTHAVPAAGGPMGAQTSSDTHTQLARVRDTYRETVMAVDHYDEEYGESLAENLAAEFGDSVAVAVADGKQFTHWERVSRRFSINLWMLHAGRCY